MYLGIRKLKRDDSELGSMREQQRGDHQDTSDPKGKMGKCRGSNQGGERWANT